MTIYDELADQIFAEVSAVLGPLHSTHLGRKLDAGDIHDAVILATDTPGGEPDRAALLIAAAPSLLKALKDTTKALGLIHDFGTATEGVGHPDMQNRALDNAHDLIKSIKGNVI